MVWWTSKWDNAIEGVEVAADQVESSAVISRAKRFQTERERERDEEKNSDRNAAHKNSCTSRTIETEIVWCYCSCNRNWMQSDETWQNGKINASLWWYSQPMFKATNARKMHSFDLAVATENCITMRFCSGKVCERAKEKEKGRERVRNSCVCQPD